jgi:hypothetical protein
LSHNGLESPDADAAEQEQDVVPDPRDAAERGDLPLEANPADTAEQARELSVDDDEDYR